MLTSALIEQVLQRAPTLTVGVLGDLFLDRYLDLDGTLTELSLETGLDAYQVVGVRSYPGASGTVLNNLVALGVGRVVPIAVIGDDGEGYELRQVLMTMPTVDCQYVVAAAERRTPTYTKPMLLTPGQNPRELNRLDIKNRTPMPSRDEQCIMSAVRDLWAQLDALVVVDHVSESDCGVVTGSVRGEIERLAHGDSHRFVLADSRERVTEFRGVAIKANGAECIRATRAADVSEAVDRMTERNRQAVFATVGPDGIVLGQPNHSNRRIPGYPVTGPIDPVGAGDCTQAAIATAVAAGLECEQAAAFGCLVASVTVQQIGTTGTASPDQVRVRWREITGR